MRATAEQQQQREEQKKHIQKSTRYKLQHMNAYAVIFDCVPSNGSLQRRAALPLLALLIHAAYLM